MATDADTAGGSIHGIVSVPPARKRQLLAFSVFVFLFGQPVVIAAVALSTPGAGAFAVIATGSILLAASATAVFLRTGGSVSRLGDFILTLTLLQILLVLLSRGLVDVLAVETTGVSVLKPALVLGSYLVAYLLVYRDSFRLW